MEFRKIFDPAGIHDGKSMLAEPEASFSTAAAKALDTLPIDQREMFQARCSAAKTMDDLPKELQDIVRPFLTT